MYKFFCCIFFFIIVAVKCKATVTDSLQIVHFSVENGLPSNNVYSVVEDRNGFIWILTDEGIVKYNGYTTKLFNSSYGLPSNDVWYLSEDARGRLWIYTHAYEVGYLKDDIYHKVDIDTRNSLTKIIRQFDRNGYVCLVTMDAKGEHTYIVDSSDRIMSFPSFNQDYRILALDNSHISALYKYKYFVNIDPGATGLKVYNKNRSFTKSYSFLLPAVLSNDRILSNDLIVPTQVAMINASIWKVEYTTMKRWGGSDGEKVALIYAIRDDFVVITDRSAYVIDKNFELKQKADYRSFFNGSVPISFFYETRSRGSKWFCTKDNGCYQTFKGGRRFYKSPPLTYLLSGAQKVGEFRNGMSWWYKESDAILFGLNREATDIKEFKVDRQLIKVIEAPDNNVLFVSKQNIEKFNPVSQALQPLLSLSRPIFVMNLYNYDYSVSLKKRTDGKEELNDLAKKAILSNANDLIWYNDSNFYVAGPAFLWNIKLFNDHTDITNIHEEKYNSIFFDSLNKRLWLYNKGSIVVLDPNDNSKVEFKNNFFAALGINVIEQIAIDKHRNVYIKDAEKIFLYNTRLGTFKFLNISVNLQAARMEVSGDKMLLAGKFGVATAHITGPARISSFNLIPNIRMQYYSRVQGMVASDSGAAIISTDKGVYILEDERLGKTKTAAKNEESLVVKTTGLNVTPGKADTLVTGQDKSSIVLDYINYFGKGDRVFSYRIAGISDWKQTTTGEVYIGELKPDRTYRLDCRINDDLWKSRNYTVYLFRLPYWYQRSEWQKFFWIAGILCFLLAILAAVLITRKVVARANKKRQIQVELELRAIHSQINPHFIFNTLSSALYFISKKNFESAYHHVNKFSKLLRLYLQASRNRYTVLSEEIELLSKYIDLQKVRFEGKFDYTIEIDKRVPTDSIQIPSLLLQPLVENAINHGLFHIERGGLLQIKFVQGSSSDELLCYIDDNGVGRERSKEIKNESENYRRSYGTKLTEELIELFEKYEKMNIEMEYLDKKAPETGTVVKLTLRNMKYMV